MKKRMMLKFAASAVMLAITITSCSKKDDNSHMSAAPLYLPVAIYDAETNQGLDSFVFKNNIIQSYYSNNQNGAWQYIHDFVYGADGKCQKVMITNLSENKLETVDSIVYGTDKISFISKYIRSSSADTSVYKLSNNLPVFSGSKDTTTDAARNKSFHFEEFNLADGNLQSYRWANYVSYSSGASYFSDQTVTYTYDDKPNGFQFAFEKNPLLYSYLVVFQEEIMVSLGKGNIKTAVGTSPANSNAANFNAIVTNTYDPVTGLLSTQNMETDGGWNWNNKYSFRKAD